MTASWIFSAALWVPLAVLAQTMPTPKDLPTTEQAASWVERDPSVVQARSGLEAAVHEGAAIASSSHEWSAKLQAQRRNYRDTNTKSSEWAAQLERPIRINGKAGLDQQLGTVTQEIARAKLGEARHEAARALADLWMEVIVARGQVTLLREQLSFAENNLAAVDKRKRAGDASALDVNVARTDISEVQRQASLAATQLAKAEARLRVRFGGGEPVAQPLSEPGELPLQHEKWRERVLADADPIKVSEAQLRWAELTAARMRADRIADPTVGVYTASEAIRNERVVGLSISIPFGGSHRDRRSLQALREVDVARASLDRQRQAIETEAAETYAEAQGSLQRWRVAEQGAAVATESARLMQRAYTLGEQDLQSLLLSRRQSLEAQRAALEARGDALRWQHRMLIDAHAIWGLQDD